MNDIGPTVKDLLTIYAPAASTVAVAIATVILVCLTRRYVRLTKLMVDSMKEARDPAISIDFELPDHSLKLVIANTGLSTAKNIRFIVTNDLQCIQRGEGQVGIGTLAPIRNGISHLVPGRKLKYYVCLAIWKKKDAAGMILSMRVDYENEEGKTFTQNIDLDLSQLNDVLCESFKDSGLAVSEAIHEVERGRRFREQVNAYSTPHSPKKPCSVCAELVEANARKCCHCGEWIEAKVQEQQTAPTSTTSGGDAASSAPQADGCQSAKPS